MSTAPVSLVAASKASTIARSTSLTAIGCTRCSSQLGTGCTSSSVASWRITSKDVEPAPITTPARSDSTEHARLSRLGEHLLDLEPRGDVLGELLVGHVGHQAGEIDEAAYAAVRHRVTHHLGAAPVPVREPAHVERVDQVADAVDVLERHADGRLVGDVAPRPLDVVPQAKRPGSGGDEDAATTSWPASSSAGTTREPT